MRRSALLPRVIDRGAGATASPRVTVVSKAVQARGRERPRRRQTVAATGTIRRGSRAVRDAAETCG